MVQIPHAFFAREGKRLGFALPEPGAYAVSHIFMPKDDGMRAAMEKIVADVVAEEGQVLLGWRDVPVDKRVPFEGAEIAVTEPLHRQVFIGRGANVADEETFERRLYLVRKVISARVFAAYSGLRNDFYIVSMSCRTVVYKGMFLSYQLGAYYLDLRQPDFESALALVHQRFSTNTFPSWRLAHPYRFVCHNGEINTVRGNVNWMAARQASVASDLYGDDISKLWPISYEGQSDTACFDNALEFLVRGGYSLPHAAMMLIPEAWAGNPLMDEERRAFYEYHAAIMEPWDGPAAMAFSDGIQIGATLDRNGLRPARYLVTADDEVIMASEAGVLPVEESRIVRKWRLQPGKMLLIDLREGRIIADDEIKASLAKAHPYQKWLARTQIVLEEAARGRAASDAERRVAARSAAGVRLHRRGPEDADGADGAYRPGSRRLDGQRCADLGALRQVEAALQHVLQAELRAGHQPADRPDPRGAGDEPRLLHRAAAEPARPDRRGQAQAAGSAPADPRQRGPWRRSAPSATWTTTRSSRRRWTSPIRRAKPPPAWRRRSTRCAPPPARRSATASTSSSCPTAWWGPTASPYPRCWPPPACTIT